jgi:urease accessory protein
MRNLGGFDGVHRHGARVAALALCTMLAPPAGAHHAIGGEIPSNGWEGFLSGLAHPILGLDHFAFVVAAGLIAALHRHGVLIPIAFAAASLIATGIHLLSWNLPAPELMISLSVLLFGVLLIARQLRLPIVVVLAAASGIFHGYAYGESIVGAEMTPLWAYLLGLALVQLAVGLSTRWLVDTALRPTFSQGSVPLRLAGFAIGFVGLAYLATQ